MKLVLKVGKSYFAQGIGHFKKNIPQEVEKKEHQDYLLSLKRINKVGKGEDKETIERNIFEKYEPKAEKDKAEKEKKAEKK